MWYVSRLGRRPLGEDHALEPPDCWGPYDDEEDDDENYEDDDDDDENYDD